MFTSRLILVMLANGPIFGQTSAAPNMCPHFVFRNSAWAQAGSLTPALIQTAYGFNLIKNQGKGQTIALIEALDNPNIEADLGVFTSKFRLPACTKANGCFQRIYASGSRPAVDATWSVEIALDVEWAHAIAPQAKILLVEARSPSTVDLLNAVDVAVQADASVVSMSFGAQEFPSETYFDSHFNVQDVVFTASSGDWGHGVQYPAASPFVVGVGGTTLKLNAVGIYAGELAWSGSGGGQSRYESQPSYQRSVTKGVRGVPDVSYAANPTFGYPVYNRLVGGWISVGGTSAGTPQWAALFAIANSLRAAQHKSPLSVVGTDLYRIATYYHPVTAGSDGNCGPICTAGVGYDYVTGLGTPRANLLIPALVSMP